ncbi:MULTISPECIES: hypothetical protein [Streptomyces]|uniref:Uncharacterized protein n=1 Tax=Streptomyces zinciresistens K42 TaxID=700597 RepID=G2G5V1_9ACTN|nr:MULTISPECIES: hypothetical protein [Streptomyces]EGX61040.1 hypothetical protein SZN_04276 [Streptomyces zinciresistens K42]MDT9696566.1 hypothetical protein [Streptomyces sp. P17]
MSELVKLLPLLACPVGMGAMMWFMTRSGRKTTGAPSTDPNTAASGADPRERELAALRKQVDDLRQHMGDDAKAPDQAHTEPFSATSRDGS